MNPVRWQRLESFVVAGLVVMATIHIGWSWWWLLVVFLAFDVSAVGYLASTKVGAFVYNLVHNYAAPAALFAAWLVTDIRWLALTALAWAFHVAVDRALGYGLKHDDHFIHTHLGWIKTPPTASAK